MDDRIRTKGSAEWNNINRKAAHTKDFNEQVVVNKVLLNYIARLQMQINSLRKCIDDDGR